MPRIGRSHNAAASFSARLRPSSRLWGLRHVLWRQSWKQTGAS